MPTPTVLAITPVSTRFNVSTGNIEMTDYYGGVLGIYLSTYNIPLAGVKGVFTVVAPGGATIYTNSSYTTPDIHGNTPVWSKNIPIPLNGDGSMVAGTYTVTYTTQITDGVHTVYLVVNTATYNFTYVRPTVAITQTVDCVSPNFTAVDTTNYVVSTITPTLTRTFVLNYPVGSASQNTPITTTAATISTGTFYQGTQTNTISSIVSYTFAATGSLLTYTVYDVITGSQPILVDCTFICNIACCLTSLEQRMANEKGVNDVEYQKDAALFSLIMGYVSLCLVDISCGLNNNVAGYLDTIQSLTNCTTGCNCDSTTPALVIGLGGASVNVVVASGGSPVTVTPVTVAGVTTYTITIDSAFVAIVNASYNTIVTSTDSSVTVTPSGTNPKTYDLAVALPAPQNRVEAKVTITGGVTIATASDITITVTQVLITGTKFQAPTFACDDPGNPNWLTITNCFKVNGFFTGTPDNNYKIIISNGSGTSSKNAAYSFVTDVILRDTTAGTFFMRLLYGNSGTPFAAKVNGTLVGVKQELTLVISE